MCLIVFAYKIHPEYPLIVVANRDEFYARATRTAHFWHDHPDVFGGRDLASKEQGTWMGINQAGRFAAVTNFREMDFNEPTAKSSRGALTTNFLCTDTPPIEYLEAVQQQAKNYKGFNLLLWDNENLFFASNRSGAYRVLQPGIYGLSNGALDEPWPKVRHAKQQLTARMAQSINPETLLEILMDREQAPDHQLPDTGIGIELERLLSSCFIHSEVYGTRASTVFLIHSDGSRQFIEQNWNANGQAGQKSTFE